MNRQKARRIAACVASLVLTVALSGCARMEGDLAEPVMEPEVIVEEPRTVTVAPRVAPIEPEPVVVLDQPPRGGQLVSGLADRGVPQDLAVRLASLIDRESAGDANAFSSEEFFELRQSMYRLEAFPAAMDYLFEHRPEIALIFTEVATASVEEPDLPPLLAWPPPNPSLAVTLRREPIVQAVSERFGEDSGDLRSVGWLIEDELSAAGYDGKIRYVGLNPETGPGRSDEFALVTGMEQIDENARPLEGPARWSRDIREDADISILGFLRALFTAPRGNYRVLVFIVTPRALQGFDPEPMSAEAVGDIETGGAVALPEEFAEVDFAPIFQVYALVYEFEKTSDQGEARHAVPGRWRASDHLAAAGAVASWVPGNQQ